MNDTEWQTLILHPDTPEQSTAIDFTVPLPDPKQYPVRLAEAMYDQPYQLYRLNGDFDDTRATACKAAFRFHY